MPDFLNGGYHIVNHPAKALYNAAIAEFNKRVRICELFTADKKPIKFDTFDFNPFGLYLSCGDLLNIISELSKRGINDFFMKKRTCNGMSTTGLLPVLFVPGGFQPASSPVIRDVCRYLEEGLYQITKEDGPFCRIDKPVFRGEFGVDSAISVITKMEMDGAVDFPSMKTIVFEYKGMCGYIHYGENPRAALLELMEFDIDDGFTNRHDDIYANDRDPIGNAVSAELQKFFIAWKENNYQGKPIPDAAALILTAPTQATLASQTRAQNPYVFMPQPQVRAQDSQSPELSPAAPSGLRQGTRKKTRAAAHKRGKASCKSENVHQRCVSRSNRMPKP